MSTPFIIDNLAHRLSDALNGLLNQSVGKPLAPIGVNLVARSVRKMPFFTGNQSGFSRDPALKLTPMPLAPLSVSVRPWAWSRKSTPNGLLRGPAA
jgi:hypothetical protein